MDEEIPNVGVLIPSYNHSKFLINRVNSILNQTYSNLKVYIVDDCSSDDSWEILQKYVSEPRVSLFKSKFPSGSPFSYYKEFLDKFSHDYWLIAESDDIASHERIGHGVT